MEKDKKVYISYPDSIKGSDINTIVDIIEGNGFESYAKSRSVHDPRGNLKCLKASAHCVVVLPNFDWIINLNRLSTIQEKEIKEARALGIKIHLAYKSKTIDRLTIYDALVSLDDITGVTGSGGSTFSSLLSTAKETVGYNFKQGDEVYFEDFGYLNKAHLHWMSKMTTNTPYTIKNIISINGNSDFPSGIGLQFDKDFLNAGYFKLWSDHPVHKKEQPKPVSDEFDIWSLDGREFTTFIYNKACKGILSVGTVINGEDEKRPRLFLCQDVYEGANCQVKRGFKYSYVIHEDLVKSLITTGTVGDDQIRHFKLLGSYERIITTTASTSPPIPLNQTIKNQNHEKSKSTDNKCYNVIGLNSSDQIRSEDSYIHQRQGRARSIGSGGGEQGSAVRGFKRNPKSIA